MSRTTQSIEVKDVVFSIENLESQLRQHKPGRYKIAWHTNTDIWDMSVRWDGVEFKDLHEE